MPLYDYQCSDCGKRFTLLKGVVADKQIELCPNCDSPQIKKLISRFGRLRSDDAVIDDLADPSKMGDLDDPEQLQKWMSGVGKEIGGDMGGDFDEMLADISEDKISAEYE